MLVEKPVAKLRGLMAIPPKDRGWEWMEWFNWVAFRVPVRPKLLFPFEGPDGFPTMLFDLEEDGSSLPTLGMRVPEILEQRSGAAVFDKEPGSIMSFRFGDLLSWKLWRRWRLAPVPGSTGSGSLPWKQGDKVQLADPTPEFFPPEVRRAARFAMLDLGIAEPKVAGIKWKHDEVGRFIFNIDEASQGDEELGRRLMKKLCWHLPGHYAWMYVQGTDQMPGLVPL